MSTYTMPVFTARTGTCSDAPPEPVRRAPSYRKPICPYVTSTFEDFQVERQYLTEKIFPKINEFCQERGTYFTPVDLQWDISEGHEPSNQMIQRRLDMIVRSCPFFIGILGERYGTYRPTDAPPLPKSYTDLPEGANWLDTNFMVAAAGGYDWILQETNQSCSIIELEVLQAAFLCDDNSHCRFYVRRQEHLDTLFMDLPKEERLEQLKVYQPENDECDEKVRDLKARIAKKGLQVKYFKTPEQLGQLVLEDWQRITDLLYPAIFPAVNTTGEVYEEWMGHEAYAETRRGLFIRTPELEDLFMALTDFAVTAADEHELPEEPALPEYSFSSSLRRKKPQAADYQSLFLLVGERGSGRTSALANWAEEFWDTHPEIKLLTHYISSSAQSTDIASCMRRIISELRKEYLEECEASRTSFSDDVSDSHCLTETFLASLSLGPCVLVLDGMEELGPSFDHTAQKCKELDWLPMPLPPQCKLIISTSRADFSYKALSRRPDTIIQMMPALSSKESRTQLLQEQLGVYSKYLSQSDMSAIMTCKVTERPLYLTILTNELREFDVYSELDSYLCSYLDAVSCRDLWGKAMQRWIRDHGWTTEHVGSESTTSTVLDYNCWVADALRLLAVSRCGLTQGELLAVLQQIGYSGETQVTACDWSEFRMAAPDALCDRPGGLISFYHQQLKEVVEFSLLKSVASNNPESEKYNQPSGDEIVVYTVSEKVQFHTHLANYFLDCPHSSRRNQELPHHLERCKDWKRLQAVLTDPRVVEEFFVEDDHPQKILDLTHYWQVLQEAGYHPPTCYWNMLVLASGGKVQKKMGVDDSNIIKEEEEAEEEIQSSDTKKIPLIRMSFADSPGNHQDEPCPSSDQNTGMTEVSMDQSELAQLMRHVGEFLYSQGFTQDAEDVLLQAHDIITQLYPLNMTQQTSLYHMEESLGKLYLHQLQKDKAALWYHRALKSVEDLIDDILLDSGDASQLTLVKGQLLDQLGSIKILDQSLRKAEILLKKAKKCISEGSHIPARASLQHHLGLLRFHMKEYEAAEYYLRQALENREKWYGKAHPEVATVLNDLAGLLCHPHNSHSYDKKKAEYMYRRTLQIREHCFGKNNLTVATTLYHLGRLMKTEAGQHVKSETLVLLRRALDIRTTQLGPNHKMTKMVRQCLINFETGMKYKQSHRMDVRTDDMPCSTLSWHSTELMQFEQKRERQKSESRPSTRQSVKAYPERYMSPEDILAGINEDSDYEDLIYDAKLKLASRGQQSEKHDGTQEGGKTEESVKDGNDENGTDLDDKLHIQTADGVLNDATFQEDFINMTDDLPSRTEIATVDDRETISHQVSSYLDTFSKADDSSIRMRQRKKNRKYRIPREQFRAQSAPPQETESMYLDHVMRVSDNSTSGFVFPKRSPRIIRSSSASVLRRSLVTPRPSSARDGVHGRNCYTPGPHTIDLHNAYNMQGPNSTIISLLGAPPCPRNFAKQLLHKSAWYHVPGRYPTVQIPVPPKRSQKRLPGRRKGLHHPSGLSLVQSWPPVEAST